MKMMRLRIKDLVDRRYLGVIRFVDQTTQKVVRRPMKIKAAGLKFFTNLSQFQVISYADGLEMHLNEFEEPPDQPDVESLEFSLTIQDPLEKYLPRVFMLKLPRKSKPKKERNDFKPIDIPLCPAANSRLSPNWSIIRASVYDLEDPEQEAGVRGALLRIIDETDQLLGSGLSDKRGEALLIIPGIPITNFTRDEGPAPDDEELSSDGTIDEEVTRSEWLASDPVVDAAIPANLEIVVAPGVPWPVDPEELEKMHADPKWKRAFKEKTDDEPDKLKDPEMLSLKTGETKAMKLFVDIKDNT